MLLMSQIDSIYSLTCNGPISASRYLYIRLNFCFFHISPSIYLFQIGAELKTKRSKKIFVAFGQCPEPKVDCLLINSDKELSDI